MVLQQEFMVVRTIVPLEVRLDVAALRGGESSCCHRVKLGDAAELVRGLIAAKGPLWLGLVAATASGELSRRSADLAMRRRGLERGRREAALHAGLGFSA